MSINYPEDIPLVWANYLHPVWSAWEQEGFCSHTSLIKGEKMHLRINVNTGRDLHSFL